MSNRVFVGKVSQTTTEQTLQDEFAKYGDVTKIDLKNGYAFVFFENDNDTVEAINNLDGKEIDGNNIVVEAARSSRDFKQKPVKRLDLRLSVSGLESRVSWQDLKDWARKAGDVTFTNIFMRDDNLKGVIEFTDAEGMENALRTLEEVPLKGLNLRLEKDDSVNAGGGNGDRPYRPIPRYNDGPPHGHRGGYDDRMGPGPMRGGYDRDVRGGGGYDRGGYGGDRGGYMHGGPPMGDRYDGPPPYRGGGYAEYRMGGQGGPDPRGFRGDSRGPPMDVRGPPMGGGYFPPHRDGRSRSRSRSRERGGGAGGDRYYRGGGGGMHGPPNGGGGPPGGMYPPPRGGPYEGRGPPDRGPPEQRGPPGGPGPYERGPPPSGGGRPYYDGPNRGAGGGGGYGGMR